MRINVTADFAKKDDCLDRMVPADLRLLVSERDEALRERDALREAALAVVERWDSPAWTWDGSTAELIGKLRTALAKEST